MRRVGARWRLSRYLEFSRDEWSVLRAATPLTIRENDLEALRGINDRISLDEVADVYLPAHPAAEPLRGGGPEPAQGVGHVPRHDRPEGAVRDRRRRQRRRGQEHVRPRPAGAAVALARPPEGRPRHDRRLPLPERRARSAGHHEPQGLPRELRHAAAADVPAGGEVGRARGAGAGLQPRRLRHRPGRGAGGAPARHPHPRGPERAAGRRPRRSS